MYFMYMSLISACILCDRRGHQIPLQKVVSHHVVAGTELRVSGKEPVVLPLSQLPSPKFLILNH